MDPAPVLKVGYETDRPGRSELAHRRGAVSRILENVVLPVLLALDCPVWTERAHRR